MAPHAIISYDDTPNDHDALMLGRVLRDAGTKLSLAYVRHAHQARAEQEQLAESEAEALLVRGSRLARGPLRRPSRRVSAVNRRRASAGLPASSTAT